MAGVDFELPGRLTVETAEETKELMLSRLKGGKAEVLCFGGGVQEVDGAGLQLLLGLYRNSVREGREFAVVNASPELHEALVCSGVDKVIATKEVG